VDILEDSPTTDEVKGKNVEHKSSSLKLQFTNPPFTKKCHMGLLWAGLHVHVHATCVVLMAEIDLNLDFRNAQIHLSLH
jgi:hypothetical protein